MKKSLAVLLASIFFFSAPFVSAFALIAVDPPVEETEKYKVETARALLVQGIELYTSERYDQAKAILQEVLKYVDDNTIAHFFLASAYDELGDSFNAKVHYNRAIELQPANFFATMGLAKLYSSEENYDAAMILYDEVLEYKDVARVYVAKGNVYFLKQDYARAMKEYQQALAKDASYSPAYFNLGNIYLFMSEYKHALRNYKNAVKYNPKSINGHLYAAFVYNYLDERENAYKHFMKAKALFEEQGMLDPLPSLDELMEKAFSDIQQESAF